MSIICSSLWFLWRKACSIMPMFSLEPSLWTVYRLSWGLSHQSRTSDRSSPKHDMYFQCTIQKCRVNASLTSKHWLVLNMNIWSLQSTYMSPWSCEIKHMHIFYQILVLVMAPHSIENVTLAFKLKGLFGLMIMEGYGSASLTPIWQTWGLWRCKSNLRLAN